MLRGGVFLSVAVIVVGSALMFIKGHADSYKLSLLANFSSPSTLNSSLLPFSGMFKGLVTLDGIYYISLGLWILLLTPVSVVALSAAFFLRERNILYFVLSLVVLFDVAMAILVVPGLVGK